jgi:hypothetical protein
MSLQRAGTQFMAVSLVLLFSVSPVKAQSNQNSTQVQAQAASKVSAEMVKGKLNPASSKPGDQVTVRMAEDVKSNGQVLLKKGAEVNGVVRSVKRAESKASAQAAAQSMIQVEWLAPAASGAGAQQLNFALSSIVYTNPLYASQQAQESAAADGGIAAPRPAPAPARSGGGLVGGVTGGVAGGVASTVGAAGNVAGRAGAAGQTSAGLLALPAPVAANSQTATSLQNNFGVSSNQLLMTGRGQAVSAGGTSSSMDLFTHMSNDAVITSPSRDFEIASGAQMQFMVSAKGQK